MSSTLRLFCWVIGDLLDQSFEIKIANTETVSGLREAIKKKKEPDFDSVPADTLKLWNAIIPADEGLPEQAQQHAERTNPLSPVKRLSGLFPDPLLDEHVHIIVRAPPSATGSSLPQPSTMIRLFCLVQGDEACRRFEIQIANTETVSGLREMIKKKKEPDFDHVPADTLNLWKVSIDTRTNLQDTLDQLELEDGVQGVQMLEADDKIQNVFPNPPDKHIHIIVRRPVTATPAPASNLDTIGELTEMLNVTHLENAQVRLVTNALKAPCPSSAAILNAFITEQRKRPFWNGRPNRGIPIQLYHPTFAKFMRAISDDTIHINVEPEECSAVHSLFHNSALLYKEEALRSNKIRFFLNKAIRHHIAPLDVRGMEPHGGCEVSCGNLYALAAVVEGKNEIGTGGCDPSHQCSLDYRQYYTRKDMTPILNRSCCPAFLIALAGPWICILGAVFVENVVVQELTDFIWIGGQSYNDDKLKSVTRMLAAVGNGISELQDFYSKLSLHDPTRDPQRFFPFIREFPFEGHVVKFSYQAYLTGPSPESCSKAIFLAKIEAKGGQMAGREVVVKFVQRYNAKAHRLLAAVHRAPALFYYSKEDANCQDLGGLTMVVMERVRGKTAHEWYGINPLPQPIFKQVRDAIETLHAENIVFADLRPPNIMVKEDEQVMLIDFDWCGVDGEDTYPITLNDDRESSNSINWHQDVKRTGIMVKEHDLFMLRCMEPQSL